MYKDAPEYKFRRANIFYEREKEYVVNYKGIVLPHKFYAGFVVFDQIILETKAIKALTDEHIGMVMNYLKVSLLKLGLLVNFGEQSLRSKRIVL